jgi:hypothetical protein
MPEVAYRAAKTAGDNLSRLTEAHTGAAPVPVDELDARSFQGAANR